MKELILISVTLTTLYVPSFFMRANSDKLKFIIPSIFALALLIMIWTYGLDPDKTIFINLLLSIAVLSSWIRTWITYRRTLSKS